MHPEERDLAYLWDLREAAQEIVAFIKGVSFDGFTKNKMIRYAVERQLLVIGETANHVSMEFQESHPNLPWRQMIGLRNILAHEYGEILVDRIWNTATVNIPQLLKELGKLIPKN
jgi:uncharacterized protein with HEPN domain